MKITNASLATNYGETGWNSGCALSVADDVGLGSNLLVQGTGYFNGCSFSLFRSNIKNKYYCS